MTNSIINTYYVYMSDWEGDVTLEIQANDESDAMAQAYASTDCPFASIYEIEQA